MKCTRWIMYRVGIICFACVIALVFKHIHRARWWRARAGRAFGAARAPA